MKTRRPLYRQLTWVGLGAVALTLVWTFLAAILKNDGNMVISYPHEAAIRSFELLFLAEAGKTWVAMLWTMLRLLIGFALSFVFGVLFGSLAGLFAWFKDFMRPLVGVFRTIPTAAVVILIVATIYGPRNAHLITYVPCILVFMVAFPLVYEAFKRGLENEDPYILYSLDLESGRNSWNALLRVRWPNTVPYVKLALAQSLGLSMKVCIMSEVLSATSASEPSVGGLIVNAQTSGAIDDILPYALIALLMMVVIDLPMFVFKVLGEEK